MRIGFKSMLVTVIIPAAINEGASVEVSVGGTPIPYGGSESDSSACAAVQTRARIASQLEELLARKHDTLMTEYGPDRLVRIAIGSEGVLDAFLWEVEYRPDTNQLVCKVEPYMFEGLDGCFADGHHPGVEFVEPVNTWLVEGVSIPPTENCVFDWTHCRNVYSDVVPQHEDIPPRRSRKVRMTNNAA